MVQSSINFRKTGGNPGKQKIIKVISLKLFLICKKVFFFNTPTFLKIPINNGNTVGEVIRIIMDNYIGSTTVDQSLMKYPNQPLG